MINTDKANLYCKDDLSKIENYDKAIADITNTWDIHHRLELTLDSEFAHTREELKRLGMYYHRPYFELIFLTHGEHQSLHHKGKPLTTEHSQKIANANTGKIRSAETCKRISESLKGKHIGKTLSPKTRQKIAEAVKGENHPMHGKHHSEESRRKMSEHGAWKGKKLSAETRLKMSNAQKGRKHGELSAEHRRKLAEAMKASWARRRLNESANDGH